MTKPIQLKSPTPFRLHKGTTTVGHSFCEWQRNCHFRIRTVAILHPVNKQWSQKQMKRKKKKKWKEDEYKEKKELTQKLMGTRERNGWKWPIDFNEGKWQKEKAKNSSTLRSSFFHRDSNRRYCTNVFPLSRNGVNQLFFFPEQQTID